MPKKETIRIRPGRPTDRFNDPIGPVPEWVDIPGATVVPRTSTEDEQRGPVIISGFMVVVGPAVAVRHTDELEIRGKIHQIDGEIGDYGRRKIFYTKRVS